MLRGRPHLASVTPPDSFGQPGCRESTAKLHHGDGQVFTRTLHELGITCGLSSRINGIRADWERAGHSAVSGPHLRASGDLQTEYASPSALSGFAVAMTQF